jgi:hypothetical protein
MISLLLILLMFGGATLKPQIENQDLRLTAKITDTKRYCAIGPDFHQLHLRVELTFTHSSSSILIMQKRCLALITYSRMAETEQELGAAFWAHTLWVASDNGDVTDSGSKPAEGFAVLKPGGSYKVRTELSLFSREPLLEKERFVQVIVPAWSGTRQQAEKLKKKWEKTGVLWIDNIKSQPFSFVLDKATRVKKCS